MDSRWWASGQKRGLQFQQHVVQLPSKGGRCADKISVEMVAAPDGEMAAVEGDTRPSAIVIRWFIGRHLYTHWQKDSTEYAPVWILGHGQRDELWNETHDDAVIRSAMQKIWWNILPPPRPPVRLGQDMKLCDPSVQHREWYWYVTRADRLPEASAISLEYFIMRCARSTQSPCADAGCAWYDYPEGNEYGRSVQCQTHAFSTTTYVYPQVRVQAMCPGERDPIGRTGWTRAQCSRRAVAWQAFPRCHNEHSPRSAESERQDSPDDGPTAFPCFHVGASLAVAARTFFRPWNRYPGGWTLDLFDHSRYGHRTRSLKPIPRQMRRWYRLIPCSRRDAFTTIPLVNRSVEQTVNMSINFWMCRMALAKHSSWPICATKRRSYHTPKRLGTDRHWWSCSAVCSQLCRSPVRLYKTQFRPDSWSTPSLLRPFWF